MGIRLISGILAIGASFWGFLAALAIVFSGFSLGIVLLFLPGYLVWIFYVTRWLSVPPLPVRYLGWVFSLIVQGSWFVYVIASFGSVVLNWETSIVFVWWGGAFLASIWCLIHEGAIATESSIPLVFRLPPIE